MVPFITLLQKPYIILSIALGIFVIFCILLFTPITFPYSGSYNFPSPQSFVCYYRNEIIRNQRNEIYGRHKDTFCMSDYNADKTISRYVKEPEFNEDTDFIPLNKSIKLHLHSKTRTNPSLIQYNFTIEGPYNMFIDAKLWNDAIFRSAKIYMGRTEVILRSNVTSYNIEYNRGKMSLPLNMVLKIHLPNLEYPKLQFTLTALQEYNPDNFSIPYYDKYLKLFPKWTNVNAKLMLIDTYTFM